MFRLKLFGSAEVLRDGLAVPEILSQRRRLALLSILAAEGGAISRDRLLLLLWPDAPTRAARHLLAESTYGIRKTLSRDAILTHGVELALNGDVVESDVAAFQQCVREGRLEEAVDLYGGPFLNGLHLVDTPEFERWSDETRTRLARAQIEALEELATRAESERNWELAIHRLRAISQMEPHSGRIACRLMRAYEASGDRAAALAHGKIFCHSVEEELGLEPDAEVVAEIRRLRAGRPIPPQLAFEFPRKSEAPAPPEPRRLPRSSDGYATGWISRWKVAVLIIAVLSIAIQNSAGTSPQYPPRAGSVGVVFPFELDGDPSIGYLREGMVNLLWLRLSTGTAIRAIHPSTTMDAIAREGKHIGDPGAASQVAAELGADWFVLGHIVRVPPDRLHLNASLYRPGNSSPNVTVVAEGRKADLADLVDDLSNQLLVALARQGRPALLTYPLRTRSLPALKAFLQGQSEWYDGTLSSAAAAFEAAIRADSTFVLPEYRLATTLWLKNPADTSSLVHAHKAAQLAGRRSTADATIIRAFDTMVHGDAALAEQMYRQILLTRPDDVEAKYWLGKLLMTYGSLSGRPVEEGARLVREALVGGRMYARDRMDVLALADRGDSCPYCDVADRRLAPGSELVRRMAVVQASARGSRRELARALQSLAETPEEVIIAAAWDLAVLLRDFDGAERAAGLLTATDRPSHSRAAGHLHMAELAAVRGRTEEAFAHLARLESLAPEAALQLRAYFLTLPTTASAPELIASTRERLVGVHDGISEGYTGPVGAHSYQWEPQISYAYLRGMLALAEGDVGAAERESRILDQLSKATSYSLASDLAIGLRARIRASTRGPATALATLDSMELQLPYPYVMTSPILSLAGERYLTARLLREAGRRADAATRYRSFDRLPFDFLFSPAIQRDTLPAPAR